VRFWSRIGLLPPRRPPPHPVADVVARVAPVARAADVVCRARGVVVARRAKAVARSAKQTPALCIASIKNSVLFLVLIAVSYHLIHPAN